MTDWLLAFLITVAVELPIVAACAPRDLRRRAAVDSAFANLVTHPLAWLAVTRQLLSWTAAETLVTLVEALVYRGITRLAWPRAAAAAQ